LKYFNEKQYFKIVRSKKLNIIGRTPKTLEAPVTLQKEKKPTPACSQESLEIIADENQPLI
jgi:hypothetical protein